MSLTSSSDLSTVSRVVSRFVSLESCPLIGYHLLVVVVVVVLALS